MAATAPFRIIKFWTEYKRSAGGLKAIDKVEYCAVGMASKSTTVARIADLRRIREAPDPDDVASNIARDRWMFVERHYDAWKAGQEAPEHGTPLAAWPGITAEQAEVMRTAGLRSVEDIASATDSVINRINLPGVRDVQASAKLFLGSLDTQRTADALAEKDKQISVLSEQLEELRQIVLAQGRGDDEAPKRRGRPPKVRDDVEAPDMDAEAA
jgi:hypothetical protein